MGWVSLDWWVSVFGFGLFSTSYMRIRVAVEVIGVFMDVTVQKVLYRGDTVSVEPMIVSGTCSPSPVGLERMENRLLYQVV